MKKIFGQKIEMTQIFNQDGAPVPVTLVKLLPATVLTVKDNKKDGYQALQVGYGTKAKCAKAQRGIFGKLGNFRHVSEVRTDQANNWERGDQISPGSFKIGDKIKVRGISKGKGFQGVVKRYHFAGSPATHGHRHDLRSGGSIGSAFPQHVMKGKKMAGQMGNAQATNVNLEIIELDEKEGVIVLKGSVPGSRHNLLQLESEGDLVKVEKVKPAETKKPLAKKADQQAASKPAAKSSDKK